MNWTVVLNATFIVCIIATIVAFAITMANLEYGTNRKAAAFGCVTVALAAVDILLLGAVWP
ncbi:hypothetical protein I5H99_gp089 [Mycobacterium phage WillSterrel]|uniref:Uncharacterized protein n=1 Tax=Mycobacterium phage WillSterrel TaxID=1897769 RepID=A0A1C9M072_9CAUD|nr:hypothetical protein I5H99_gp089 [Mycobacterium phage WillSterrel]AOQ28542.1 hypothetical protein SEA_WILLSTERREL_89 [Mycobacterium phage WillSterrel]AYQ99604.1 hypothetical protein PBI_IRISHSHERPFALK_90 [Mycobacterium phage IrishSherpFalk]